MPKMKTNSSAKKRFKVTGTGKVKRAKAFKNHILTKKSTKRKRALGNDAIVTDADMSNVKFMLRLGK
jgi:large subunit ribosomal protein L35